MSPKPASEKIDSAARVRAGSVDRGIRESDRNQLKYIKKLRNVEIREQVPLVDLFMRLKGQWVHKGQSCGYCGTNMNLPRVIEYHRYVCKVLNKKDEDDADSPNH